MSTYRFISSYAYVFRVYMAGGLDGDYVCLDRFGESAPASLLMKKFGFTPENVADKAEKAFRAAK